ncbi:Receptor-type tyrosine-protein phosphatase alpha [Holothuria leucospilota]|uniref:protein-tyrosine-phosphatase n=1 Tax=Holothuria leucospilota TaxID=206669 RepID=A0A9Q1H9D0_HOLLE|nr:Receptor-type tyrosine-protein phosphatase alpha [Holothuria leucospilota]
MYGFNCAEECTCVQDADCDSFDGTCTGSSCGVGTVYTCDRNDLDVTITPSRQEVNENDQFTVTCIVNLGQSDVTVNWTSPSGMEIVSNNIKYSLISAENAHYLTVRNAVGGDSGNYSCTAFLKQPTQAVTEKTAIVDIFVRDFPDIVNLTRTGETSSSLTFMWDISDTGNDILTCRANYSDNEMSVGSQPCDFDTECEIEELSPYTNYSVTIECRNKAGYSTPLAGGGRTLAAAPLAPGNVQVSETTENCEVTWTASESANGPKLFYQVMQSVKQRNEGESGASVVVEVTKETSYSTEKETLLKNSEYMFSVCANNSEFKSACTFAEGSCITNTAAPEEIPPFVAPDTEKDVSNSSVTLTLTEVNTRNGPISCYEFVVFKRAQDHSGGGSPDEEVPFDQVKTAPEDDLPYRSVVLTHEEYSKMEPVTIGLDGAVSSCTLSGNNRRKRRSNMVDGNRDLVATNSPLSSDTQYDIFMRTYTPTDDGRFQYASSDYVNVMTLKGEEKGGGGGAPGGLIAFLILLILAVIIAGAVFIVWRKRNMTDKPDTENLPMEINNINGGGADGHLDGKNRAFEEDEMIAEVPPINIDQLGERILEKHKHNDKLFFAEFRSLMSTNPEATIEAFNNVSNKEKNRYINIPCYDHSRVKLNKIEDDENSDYINANYVDGYSVPEKFIAAQGPKEETVEDFWRMIWEQNTKTIIMLTKCFESGRDKCFQYWPDGGEVSYGKFTVCLDSTLECPDYVIRQLRISMNKEDDDEEGADEETEKRIVTQFHFLAWPDHGVPEYPYTMLAFIKRIRQMTQNKPEKGQIVIHCSAGVGRTGTYITIDAMLDRLKEQKTVDIFNYIQKIRLQRSTLVQSQVQYVFIYHALHEEHLYGHTEVKLNDLKQYFRRLKLKTLQDDNSPLHLEFKTAATLPVKDTGTKEASKPGNKEKNRIRNYLPYDKNRVSLERLVGDEDSTYINASYINGYERRNMYIITQAPMENTASDFWRMVWDSLTSTVVMLTDLEEKGNEMCVKFWPEEEPKTFGNLTIELADQEEEESFTIKDFTLSNNQGVSGRKVRMYQFHGWPEIGVPDCDSVTYLATVSHEYQKAAEEQESADQSKHPIIVFCHTGVGRTAIWCALSILLERAKAEGVVDVFQTVRTLRQQRQHMVQDTTQYEFLYQAVLSHLGKLDDMYENLQS